MRQPALLLLAVPALLGASTPQDPAASLSAARSEAAAALAEQQRLERAAAAAQGDADRLRARRAAAVQAILAAEARISAAEAERRLLLGRLAALRARLERQQRPVTSLLGGLAIMGRRPPLLALADGGSTDEMVRVRLLLDSTLPVIRRRTAALSGELSSMAALERRSAATVAGLARSRAELAARQQEFASLEEQAIREAAAQGAAALGAGDVALAAGETAERLAGEAQTAAAARRIAGELASLGPAPLRPGSRQDAPAPLDYILPAEAAVTRGFGSVNASGIRARGITLSTRRGSAVRAPASGIVRFAGPFRDYDGVVIIDHGRGWTSLIIGIATPLKVGDRVRLGGSLGRALGPIEVELSRNGQRLSPAIIAGSSHTLSNGRKDG